MNTIKYIDLTDILPDSWNWFLHDMDFDFGDGELSLVSAERLYDMSMYMCKDAIADGYCHKFDADVFTDKLKKLGKDYVNLLG